MLLIPRVLLSGFILLSHLCSYGQSVESIANSGQWDARFSVPGLAGPDGFAPAVYDFARGRNGEILATGRFSWYEKNRIAPLARFDGNEWTSVTDNWQREVPEIGFTSIAVNQDGRIALSRNSGPFGVAPSEIWLNAGDEVRIIGNLNGSVRSMVWFQGRLWVAGFFQLTEGRVTHLAVWDGINWSNPPGGPADKAVYKLVVSGDSLLIAGDFTSVGGISARGVAEWNGTAWKAYDLPANSKAIHVYTVARDQGGNLYVGGAIQGGALRWNGSGWERVGGGLYYRPFEGVVGDLVVHRGDLYATGCFSHVNGPPTDANATPALSVARFRTGRWESLDDGTQPIGSAWFEYGVCGDEPSPYTAWDMRYQRLFSDGERVFLGGMMPGVDGVPSQSVAAYDGQKWQAFGKAGDGVSGSAMRVAAGGPNRNIYTIGGITHAGDEVSKSRVYRYENGWHAVGGLLPEGLGCDKLAVDRSGVVFLACTERSPQASRTVVLRMNGDSWRTIETGVQGNIWDMRMDPSNKLWIVGGVRLGQATGSGFIARLDSDRFTVVEDGFNSMVFRIAFPSATNIVVGGAFTQIDGAAYERIARWNGEQWQPLGSGLTTAVLALAASGNSVYVSTESSQDPNVKTTLLGSWNGSQWIELGTPENGLPAPREKTVHGFQDLFAEGKYLVAVGSVWPQTGGRNVLVYDGTRLQPLAGGLNAINVLSVALASDGLWFAGQIAEAGSGDNLTPSVGIARFGPPDNQ